MTGMKKWNKVVSLRRFRLNTKKSLGLPVSLMRNFISEKLIAVVVDGAVLSSDDNMSDSSTA